MPSTREGTKPTWGELCHRLSQCSFLRIGSLDSVAFLDFFHLVVPRELVFTRPVAGRNFGGSFLGENRSKPAKNPSLCPSVVPTMIQIPIHHQGGAGEPGFWRALGPARVHWRLRDELEWECGGL